MGLGKGSGRGRPKGSGNKTTQPQTMSGGKAMRAATPAAAAAQLFPGVARAPGFQGGADRGATASAGTQPAPDVDEEAFLSCDDDSDDDGSEEGEVPREGEGARVVKKSRYVKCHPVLEAVSAAVKTLPKVVGQKRCSTRRRGPTTSSSCRSRRCATRYNTWMLTSCARRGPSHYLPFRLL